nr:AMP-binding protein [Gammaproteobacteria bacterium]
AVMQGYWNLPERTELAFHTDESGRKWYKTGDIVMDQAGEYIFVGRRDRMIKKRGYRIELGEIEACLYGHAEIREAGVVAHAVTDGEIQVVAFISTKGGAKLSIIGLKQFCSEHLPLYMIPDRFNQREALPKTSTDKVNYQQLLELLDH